MFKKVIVDEHGVYSLKIPVKWIWCQDESMCTMCKNGKQ